MRRFLSIISLGAGLAMLIVARPAAASQVELETFDSPFSFNAVYGSWGAPFATLTSNPTNYEVNSHSYGSSYTYLGGNIDGSAEDTVQFDVTVTQGVAGVVLDLNDSSNNGEQYAWYGLTPGGGNVAGNPNEYLLTMPVSAGTYFDGTGVLNTSSISQMNLGVDPGSYAGTYDVQFNDLSLVSSAVPEPTTLSIAAVGGLLALRRRRRR